MNIPKPLKVVLLALTLWIPLYMLFFMLSIGSMANFDLLFALHGITMATTMVTMVVYIIHLIKARMDGIHKVLWAIVMLCAWPIGSTIYFFMNVWPEPAKLPEVVTPTL